MLLGFTGFYLVLVGFTGFDWAWLGFNWFFTRFYWVLLGFTGFLLVFTGLYRVILGFTGFYWVLLSFTGLSRSWIRLEEKWIGISVGVGGWVAIFGRRPAFRNCGDPERVPTGHLMVGSCHRPDTQSKLGKKKKTGKKKTSTPTPTPQSFQIVPWGCSLIILGWVPLWKGKIFSLRSRSDIFYRLEQSFVE